MNHWTNQYIELVSSKPDLILVGKARSAEIAETDKEILLGKLSSASRFYCELGCGSGKHLIELAKRDSQAFYLGIELRFKRVFKTAEKAEKENIKNLLVMLFDATQLFDLLPKSSLDGIYINFPDPWEKRRRQKHRLITIEFIAKLKRALKKNGFFAFKTDHHEYFTKVQSLFNLEEEFKIIEETEDLHNSSYVKQNIMTEFESLFVSQNQKINYFKAVLKN